MTGRTRTGPDPLAPAVALRTARRDLALAAVTVVGLSRLLDGPLLWLVALLLLAGMALATLHVLGHDHPATAASGVPVEALVLPSVAAVAALGALRLVPVGVELAPALAAVGVLVHRAVVLEDRLLAAPRGPSDDDRTAVLVTALLVGFLAFAGVAALVPGALVEAPGAGPLAEGDLLVLAGADALVAFLLGYRVVALRVTVLRAVLASALTYAAAVAIGAAALRAMEIPRLLGPALLILAFYLWDAVQASVPARRRDLRWVWHVALLLVLGALVIAWNVLLRPV